MTFRVAFSFEDRAWVATAEEPSSLSWVAASPVEALEGLMALTPAPSGITEYDDDDVDDSGNSIEQYHRELIMSGNARGCECDKPACHCVGIADLSPFGFGVCACCMAECPQAHDDYGE